MVICHSDHITAGAGAIVGSSSSAIFYDGVTVRGGSNDVGDADSTSYLITKEHVDINNFDNTRGGQGGDALYHNTLDRMVRSWQVSGTVSRMETHCNQDTRRKFIPTTNGQSLDMQLVEEGDGKVVLNNPEKCGGTTLAAAMFYQRKVRPS